MPHGLWKIPIISRFCSFPSQRLHLLQWNLICRLIIYEYIGQVKFWVRSSYFWQSYAPWTLKNSDYLQFPFIFFSEVFKGGGIKCFTNISRLNLISNSLIDSPTIYIADIFVLILHSFWLTIVGKLHAGAQYVDIKHLTDSTVIKKIKTNIFAG